MPVGQHDRVARADDRRRRLDEHQRLGRQRLALLRRVVLVVEPDADDLRRLTGASSAVRVARDLVARLRTAEQVALEQPPRSAVRASMT